MADKHHEPTLTETVLPSVERIQHELASAQSIDDFFGKEGIFARLFADTLEHMLEAELTAQLGYPTGTLAVGGAFRSVCRCHMSVLQLHRQGEE